jgi:uncharacterized membrane protein YhaH (DUF805 family)
MNTFFGFKGRIGRTQWWLGQLIGAVFYLGWISYAMRNMPDMVFTSDAKALSAPPEMFNPFESPAFLATAVGWTWVYLATTSKRLHDRGYSGVWASLGLLPMVTGVWMMNTCPLCTGDPFMFKVITMISLANYLIGPYLLVMCGFMPGDRGDNQYGPPPGSGSKDWNERSVSEGVMPQSGLAKLDDAYFDRYRETLAQRQPQQQSQVRPTMQPASGPIFGKR